MDQQTGLRIQRGRAAAVALIALWVIGLITPVARAAPQAGGVLGIGYLGTAASDAAQGAQLAIDQINSAGGFEAGGTTYQLELHTLLNPPSAESLANDILALAAQDVVAFLGPDSNTLLTTDNMNALITSGIPVLTGATSDTVTDNDLTDTLIRIRAPEQTYSAALANYMVNDLGLTSIALVQTDLESAQGLSDFEAATGALGVRIAGKVQLAGTVGLEDQARALLGLNPEAVVMWGALPDAEFLLRLLRDGGWPGTFAFRYADEAARAKALSDTLGNGILGVTSWSYAYPGRAARIFLDDFLVTFGHVPGPLAAAAYDAMWYLRATIIEAGIEPAAIRAALVGGAPLDLVAGTLRPADFGNGDLIHMAMVYQLGPGGGPTVVAVFNHGERATIEDAGNQ